MSVVDRVQKLCEPILEDLGLDLFDLEYEGGVLRIAVERAGGADLGAVAEATRRISRTLDEHDPVSGRYTLEVSTPGLERTLRTPAHFTWAIGKQVAVKTSPGTEGDRRIAGVVESADEHAVTVHLDDAGDERRTLAYHDIERAHTVFVWESTPKPGKKPKGGRPASDRTSSTDHEVEAS